MCSAVILGSYFNYRRGVISVFELAMGVIITCVSWIYRGVIVISPRLHLGSVILYSRLSDLSKHQLEGVISFSNWHPWPPSMLVVGRRGS